MLGDDSILAVQVNGSDLRNATHDQAVDVIRNATNPVHFLVQSLATPPGVCLSLCICASHCVTVCITLLIVIT